jgi:predicted Rossmann fold nucleotide-binding protein DprA/Smf involved in DNA uptake
MTGPVTKEVGWEEYARLLNRFTDVQRAWGKQTERLTDKLETLEVRIRKVQRENERLRQRVHFIEDLMPVDPGYVRRKMSHKMGEDT